MKSVIFKSINISQEQYNDVLVAMKNFSYDAESGEGVQISEEHFDYVKCIYCYETLHSQNTYNPETNEFDKLEFKRIELVPFVIDLKFKTLDIIGNKQKSIKVVDMIGKLSKYKIAIADVEVNPIKTLLQCAKEGITYSVVRVKIENFIFFDNIIGNCVLNLSDYAKTDELLKKYENQIVNFTASLSLEENYIITFYKSGAISLYKEFEDIDIELIRALKMGL